MDPTDAEEFYEERAAIIQYDGGAKRLEAEYSAGHLVRVYCERTGKPLPRYPIFHIYKRSTTAWDEDAGKAYYVAPK